MQKGTIKGIGDVIKAHTTEKTIDELRASGKKRVRVVSGQRVMEIIQAIVDDTIDREVGEITTRDRNRIVSDTRERFDRVLKMQTGLEQTVNELRSELRESDLERERLKADKGFLEQQVQSVRKSSGEPEAVTRLGRDIDRLRESVDEIHRRVSTTDEAAIGRAVERLTARDEANARRMAAELDDVRKRIDGIARDTARAKDSTLEALADRLAESQRRSDQDLAKRLETEFNGVHERITELRDRVSGAEASSTGLDRLGADLDALEQRMRGVEQSSEDLAERISSSIAIELVALREALVASRSDVEAASADALSGVERRLAERMSEESGELVRTVADLAQRVTAIDDRTGNAVEAVAERVAERVVIDAGALTDAVARVASRVDARIDEITQAVQAADANRAGEVKQLRQDVLAATADHSGIEAALSSLDERHESRLQDAVDTLDQRWSERHDALLQAMLDGAGRLDAQVSEIAERTTALDVSLPGQLETVLETVLGGALANAMGDLREELAELSSRTVEAQSATPAAVEIAMGAVRDELAAVRDELGAITSRAVASESGLREAVHESVAGLRTELEALASRQAESQQRAAELAARQDEAIRALSEAVSTAAAAQTDAMNTRFEGALETALDKITRTMESATARPIEISVEATDMLLDKIFDAGDDEITSNLGQLEVERRSGNGKGIANSLGKLRALRTPSKNGTD